MSVIEHSILIPTAVENVWQFISNIENNPLWLADCRSISFLTSYKQGRGARWRHTNENGRDYVIEITNWYERVGYRYIIVNGAPYATNAGVIRLQETPEGTIVQWTFEYTLSGLLSGMRNALGIRRKVENNIIDSLQTLYKQVNKSKNAVPFSPKSLMQDAPDAEARSHYKPRHPSTFADKADEHLLIEPPISEEDTKKRAVISLDNSEVQTNMALNVQEVRATLFDDRYAAAVSLNLDDAVTNTRGQISAKESLNIDIPEKPTPTVEVSTLSSTSHQTDHQFDLPRLNEASVTDTSQLNIFDLFGLPRPSETQQMRMIQSDNTAPPSSQLASPTANRVGKRILLRRSMIKVRH